jgi:ankyrin repeat protein
MEKIVPSSLKDGRADPSAVNNDGDNCLHLSAMNRLDSKYSQSTS